MTALHKMNAVVEAICLEAMAELGGRPAGEELEAAAVFWALPLCMISGWGLAIGQIGLQESTHMMEPENSEFFSCTSLELGIVLDEDLDRAEEIALHYLATKIAAFSDIYSEFSAGRLGTLDLSHRAAMRDPFLASLLDENDGPDTRLLKALLICVGSTLDQMAAAARAISASKA